VYTKILDWDFSFSMQVEKKFDLWQRNESNQSVTHSLNDVPTMIPFGKELTGELKNGVISVGGMLSI
jgi:hypothetical protein